MACASTKRVSEPRINNKKTGASRDMSLNAVVGKVEEKQPGTVNFIRDAVVDF
jgi:hypothetical protein